MAYQNDMQCADIRRKFIEYYQQFGFQLLPRASMLHPSIPMSFVMSAGLVQVETSLANTKHRPGNKFVLVQDCFRHFDLERVGTDNLHLSLFEMPAAFVFGENGRQTVLPHIWNFVTNEIGLNPARIWVSYFAGGDVEGHHIPQDTLTYQTWRGIGVPESRLVGLGRQHNYWVQGGGIEHENGAELRKCGANTELFYDFGAEFACSSSCQPGCPCGRFIEFSNSLFVSHHLNHQTNTLTLMDDPFTETVIGNERVAMIAQGVSSVFDTTTYRLLVEIIMKAITQNNLAPAVINESVRVIADHLRALYILVADGAPAPGKDGRARIIKLLIRRILTRQILLGIQLETDLPAILQQQVIQCFSNGHHVPATVTMATVQAYLETEKERFLKTIIRGEQMMDRMLKDNQGNPLSGEQMVELEKRGGLPFLLIKYRLQEKDMSCQTATYQKVLGDWKQSQNRG